MLAAWGLSTKPQIPVDNFVGKLLFTFGLRQCIGIKDKSFYSEMNFFTQ